jgi:chromosomal replication initiator protein
VDETEVVSAVKRNLIKRIGRERFELWFSRMVRLEAHSGELFVLATDQFLLDRLRKQFGNDMTDAARQTPGCSGTVYHVDASIRAEPPDFEAAETEEVRTTTYPSPIRTAAAQRPNHTPRVPSGAAGPSRRSFARLETFVVGDGNRVAHTAAQSVVRRPGSVSPMFIYGPSGSGKTHLLEGVWSAIRYRTSRSRVLFLSAEQFTSHFLEALQGGGLPNFRRKCRAVDLLIVDDVQFFAGKRATIIELQHTIDALLRAGKQLVLAADRPPAQLAELGSETIARFSGGLVCSVDEADYPTRLEITRRFAKRLQISLTDKVLELIAAELGGDSRQICGALNRLEATSLALERPMTLDLARATLQDVFRATQRVVRLPDIERAVCDAFGLDPKSLRHRTKAKSISHPRMLAMWLARKYTQAAFTEISEYFGRRSHSTVISAEKKISRWVAEDSKLQLGQQACGAQDAIQRVERKLRTG